jgi:hypothetical protein
MLKRRCPGSIQRRFSAGELGSFFFKKLQVDLQPPDLLIQLGWIDAFGRLGRLLLEGRSSLVDQPSLPLMDLRRMDLKPLGQLADRLSLLDRLQRHASLEGRVPILPPPSHRRPPDQSSSS